MLFGAVFCRVLVEGWCFGERNTPRVCVWGEKFCSFLTPVTAATLLATAMSHLPLPCTPPSALAAVVVGSGRLPPLVGRCPTSHPFAYWPLLTSSPGHVYGASAAPAVPRPPLPCVPSLMLPVVHHCPPVLPPPLLTLSHHRPLRGPLQCRPLEWPICFCLPYHHSTAPS